MLFIIPPPLTPDPAPFPGAPFSTGNRFSGFVAPPTDAPADPMAPQNQPAGPAVAQTAPDPAEPELLHIPCPNGHELETPVDMLDQQVLCPQCNAQFLLRRKDSIEFKAKKEKEDRLRSEKLEKFWLKAAIAAVVIVVLGLVAMILVSQLNK